MHEFEMIPRNKSLCLIFTFDRLHNVHLEISNLVKEWMIRYILLDRLEANPDNLELQRRPLCLMLSTLMRAPNSTLGAML